MKSDEVKIGDVRTHGEWRRLGVIAETRPIIKIAPQEVPPLLRHLIPFVERWAIGCDVRRRDYFEKQPEADIYYFWRAVCPHLDAVNQWLDSLPESTLEWPEAATHFLVMLKAHGEAISPEEVKKLRKIASKAKSA